MLYFNENTKKKSNLKEFEKKGLKYFFKLSAKNLHIAVSLLL